MKYIYELEGWPNFTWDMQRLLKILSDVRYKQGLLAGRMYALGFDIALEANIEILTTDTVKSNAIEEEIIDPKQVRSSLARRLGADIGGLVPVPRHIDGIVEVMLDAVRNYEAALTAERLFGWHSALFPTGYSGLRKITAGAWRTDDLGAMQVVSGRTSHEKIHFQAPPSVGLEGEMALFFDWLNGADSTDDILKAAIAHFWFVTIHPFDDGNGRIARTIADMLLARAENSPMRFYSMSAYIEKERNSYYEILEKSQKNSLDITDWLEWFLKCLEKAVDNSHDTLFHVLQKNNFWKDALKYSLNERQRRVLNRLLDGFEGKFTTAKYAAICKCSSDTALRDINELTALGLLRRSEGGGRSTSYEVNQKLNKI